MTWLLIHLYKRSVLAWLAGTCVVSAAIVAIWLVVSSSVAPSMVDHCVSSPSACTPADLEALQTFSEANRDIYQVLLALPLLMGVFIGAPIMGRELESRTHRLVWTQGVTPMRWLLTRSALVVIFCVALAAVIGGAMTIWLGLATALGGGTWTQFDSYPPVFEAYVVFAVALGLVVATVTGRTVVAMAIAGVLWLGGRAAVGILLRPMLLDPVIRRGVSATNSQGDWYLGLTYVDSASRRLSEAQVDAVLRQFGGGSDPYAMLQQHGIFVASLYQPASRFWTFQSIEASLFILLSIACFLVAAVWVNWRLTRE